MMTTVTAAIYLRGRVLLVPKSENRWGLPDQATAEMHPVDALIQLGQKYGIDLGTSIRNIKEVQPGQYVVDLDLDLEAPAGTEYGDYFPATNLPPVSEEDEDLIYRGLRDQEVEEPVVQLHSDGEEFLRAPEPDLWMFLPLIAEKLKMGHEVLWSTTSPSGKVIAMVGGPIKRSHHED